jgi:flagellar assembly protein FliH
LKATVKYLFDEDFGGTPANRPGDRPVARTEHDKQVTEASEAGYAKGIAAAAAETARLSALALQLAASSIGEIARRFSEAEARIEAEAVDVAAAIARKLAPELVAREPFAEVSALVRNCLSHLSRAPHLVVRINDQVYQEARDKLERIAHDSGFEGRLVILAEAAIAPGDCRIEWADGGVSRTAAETDAVIATMVQRYIAARFADGNPAQLDLLEGFNP